MCVKPRLARVLMSAAERGCVPQIRLGDTSWKYRPTRGDGHVGGWWVGAGVGVYRQGKRRGLGAGASGTRGF